MAIDTAHAIALICNNKVMQKVSLLLSKCLLHGYSYWEFGGGGSLPQPARSYVIVEKIKVRRSLM